MRLFRCCAFLITAGLLLSTGLFAQDADRQNEKDTKASTMTGCLSKDSSGAYTLTDNNGTKITVTGPQDLDKHAANHTVTLTGKMGTDATGKPTFEASKIQHVSDSCKGPGQ